MYLLSLATANPPHNYTQQDTWEALQSHSSFRSLKYRSISLLEKILTGANSGIETRQFISPDIACIFPQNAQQLNQSFEQHAPALAAHAIMKALEIVDIGATQLDALFLCTCTGYLCPGPSSYVAEILGLRSDAYLSDIVGLGCGAAIPTLRAAHGYLAANPSHKVAVVAVEISSAAFYLNDDPGVLISLCLFGDGAAAAILSGDRAYDDHPRFHSFDTIHLPHQREKIRFVNADGKLKNQLHRDVPMLAADAVKKLFSQLPHPPARILSHSGGRDVIDAIEAGIPGMRLIETRNVLRRHGNMSSPSVLFALEEMIRTQANHESLWLTAFGAGFAAHSCVLD